MSLGENPQMHEYLNLACACLLTPPNQLNIYWAGLVLIAGLIIGSYLNVVIYRGSAKYLPNETNYKGKLDTCHPKQSFCPQCLHPLSWSENIPLISWIIQGAKCKHCKAPISIEYPTVEGLNALGWVLFWILSPSIGQFLIYATFLSLLIAVTAIDLKTLRIPNKITITGIVILLLLNAATNPCQIGYNILYTLGAGVLGYALVELGKLLFGNKTVKLKVLTEFTLNQKEKLLVVKDADKSLEESEPISTDELFIRNSDTIRISGEIDNIVNKKNQESYALIIKKEQVIIETRPKGLPPHQEIVPQETIVTGKIKEITMPQEALGMGDVKLLMLMAAALGFPNFIHAMTLGAIAGLVYAVILRISAIAKKGNPPSLIAFGPWLSIASIAMVLWTLFKST